MGAGIIDLARAMNPPALAAPASLSFELVRPVGNHAYRRTFTLTNSSGAAQTYALSAPAAVTLRTSSLTLAAGASADVTVTVADRGVASPGQDGYPQLRRGLISVSSGAGSIRVPYLYVLDYNR